MNPEDILPPQQPAPPVPQPVPPEPDAHATNALPVNQPGERTIFTIKRHPIGILGVYAVCGLVLIVTAILAFAVMPSVLSNSSTSQIILAGTLVFAIVAVGCVAFALVATKIYWGNSWTLTTDSLTQVNQSGLFRRQSSQLAVDDIEDVTAEQNGMPARIFNYGVLKAETAGERSKFMFIYCPNPNYYAQQVLAAREAFEQDRRAEGDYKQPPQPPAGY